MHPRYARPVMLRIWSEKEKFRLWFEIEALAAEAMAEIGDIPTDAAKDIRRRGDDAEFDLNRIAEIDAEIKHDVLAFLTHLAEIVGESSRYVHRGLTSYDVLDTALSVRLARSADVVIDGVVALKDALRRKSLEHRRTLCVGRTHGMHAEATSFGLKLLYAYAEFSRAERRMRSARDEIAVCALSGAVGTYATIDPRVERFVAERLGLAVESVSTQVIARDRHAAFFASSAVTASSLERLATEIRHLQRSEVSEVSERFAPNQKGSSAMPHKKNPVLSENVTGLARMIRAMCFPAMENVALWHERDISHSSVERMIAPDVSALLDFALARMADVVENLEVDVERMRLNLESAGDSVFSQSVLLALVDGGMSREEAYATVQRAAHGSEGFRAALSVDPRVVETLSSASLSEAFDSLRSLRRIDEVFERTLSES